MHPSHAAWFGIFALAGFCVLLAFTVPEARNHPEALRDPAWWFWVTLMVGMLTGIIPYLLLYFFVGSH